MSDDLLFYAEMFANLLDVMADDLKSMPPMSGPDALRAAALSFRIAAVEFECIDAQVGGATLN
jgi:hypothetical protein